MANTKSGGLSNMLNIIQLVLSVVLILLCLLQSEKVEGVMSLTNRDIALFKKDKRTKKQKLLSISTAIVGALLMISIALPIFVNHLPL